MVLWTLTLKMSMVHQMLLLKNQSGTNIEKNKNTITTIPVTEQ